MKWRTVVLTLALVIALTNTSPNATAASGTTTVQLAEYLDQSGQLIQIFGTVGSTAPMASPGCTYTDASIWAQGCCSTVWRLYQRVDWCWDGSIVTSYGRQWTTDHDGLTYWKDLGAVNDTDSTPLTGAPQTVGYHRHHFAECTWYPGIGWVCGNDNYPWIRTTVHGDGTSLQETGL